MNKHDSKKDNDGYNWLRSHFKINPDMEKKKRNFKSLDEDVRLKKAQDLCAEMERRKADIDPLQT